jgi:hypothetical protein
MFPGLSPALPVLSLARPCAPRWNSRATPSVQSTLEFDHPGILVHNSQTLPEAPSDIITFCWCNNAKFANSQYYTNTSNCWLMHFGKLATNL